MCCEGPFLFSVTGIWDAEVWRSQRESDLCVAVCVCVCLFCN